MTRSVFAMVLAGAALVTAPLASTGGDPGAVGSFRRLANFNVPGGTSAEIIAATPDGRHVLYSDAIGHKFGLVDISNPTLPQQLRTLTVTGDPTSVAVLPGGTHALGVVQPGRLLLIDLSSFTVQAERDW
jgi:hypothetical protein